MCFVFQYRDVRRGHQQGGREDDDLQNLHDMTSYENPLFDMPLNGNFISLIFFPLCAIAGEMDLFEDLKDSQLVWVLTSAISVIFSIFVVIPIEQVQYVSFLFQIAMRSFVYALTGAFVPTA